MDNKNDPNWLSEQEDYLADFKQEQEAVLLNDEPQRAPNSKTLQNTTGVSASLQLRDQQVPEAVQLRDLYPLPSSSSVAWAHQKFKIQDRIILIIVCCYQFKSRAKICEGQVR